MTRKARLQNDRGAVFLLAIYFSALVLLLVGGVSLQRTNTEVRASQLSRDLQQAFWFSEAAIDHTIQASKTDTFKSLTTYPVPSLPKNATFRIVPTNALIYNNNRSDRRHFIRSEFNPWQKVTKRIEGVGATATGRKQAVNATFTVDEPLRGIWANRTIAVGGGRNVQRDDIFLSGDLYAQVGSVVSDIQAGQLNLHGLVNVTDPGVWAKSGNELWQGKLDFWRLRASNDLRSIKNGYRWANVLKGLPLNESDAEIGGTYSDVQFVNGAATSGTTRHVDGAMSVGLLDTVGTFNAIQCTSELQLGPGTVTIDERFECDPNSQRNPANVNCTARFENRGKKEGEIRLCLASIVPQDEAGWMNVLLDQRAAPHLIFRKPATVILTGGHKFDFDKYPDMAVPIPGFPLPLRVRDIPTLEQNGIHRQWQVTLGAKISGIDESGAPVPISIYEAEAKGRRDEKTDKGMIFIKPDDNFQGSIYAPESLVVVRARECTKNNSCGDSKIKLQYVVGDEVAIELESDRLQIGSVGQDTKDPSDVAVEMKSWSSH